ncbi:MAG: hypothetical protein LBH36_01245 [Candidatus Nomurabacteria bacterium]|jgi:hypothetical protein|nr:hypothetical protein [Candidatus Nomurabacteria bacterium]
MFERDEMIDGFRAFVKNLGHVPTTREYKDLKKSGVPGPSFKAIKRVFGSWNDMLEESGLPVNRKVDWVKVPDKHIIWLIREFTVKHGRPPMISDFRNHLLEVDYETVIARFGNLPNALAQLGLKCRYGRGVDYDRIVRELKVLAIELGRTPTRDEFEARYGSTVYRRNGGYSWTDVVKMAGLQPIRNTPRRKP